MQKKSFVLVAAALVTSLLLSGCCSTLTVNKETSKSVVLQPPTKKKKRTVVIKEKPSGGGGRRKTRPCAQKPQLVRVTEPGFESPKKAFETGNFLFVATEAAVDVKPQPKKAPTKKNRGEKQKKSDKQWWKFYRNGKLVLPVEFILSITFFLLLFLGYYTLKFWKQNQDFKYKNMEYKFANGPRPNSNNSNPTDKKDETNAGDKTGENVSSPPLLPLTLNVTVNVDNTNVDSPLTGVVAGDLQMVSQESSGHGSTSRWFGSPDDLPVPANDKSED